ncbi:MAG: hypothetical protein JNK82_42100 [Myxococcaceae bacterium]|nr:hypothetical protein [Myxococcaceae bacterium]
MEESRIRLEGRLETVERTVAELKRGLVAAKADDFEPLWRALTNRETPEVVDACEAVQKMTVQDRTVAKVLDRLWALMREAEGQVAKRRVMLLLPPAPSVMAGARDLVDDTLVFTGRRGQRWQLWVLTGVCVAALAFTFFRTRGGIVSLWPLIFIVARNNPMFQHVDVRVTKRRVLLKERAVALADVKRAEFQKREPKDKALPFELVLELKSGELLKQTLPLVEDALVQLLHKEGIEVTGALPFPLLARENPRQPE